MAQRYVDRLFFTQDADGNSIKKNFARIDWSAGDPDTIPDNRICLMENYKVDMTRGRKDPLKGRSVLVIDTPKGPVYLPFEEAEDFAKYLNSYVIAAKIAMGQSQE